MTSVDIKKKEEGKAHMSHEATNYNFLKQEGNFQMSQKKKKSGDNRCDGV